MSEHKNIYEAILAVYSVVGYVQKKGKNQAQNYNYAGEKDFIEALRPAMIDAKIIIYPSGVKDKQVLEVRKGDKVSVNITATYLYTLVHIPSGSQIIAEVSGEGSDPLDKGSYKGMTGAFKYALKQTFMIETGNDPENDGHKEPESAPAVTNFQTGAQRRTTGTEILAAMNACANTDELNQVKQDYKQDINRFKISKNPQDKEFFAQIVKRGGELMEAFNKIELNDDIAKALA